MTTSSIPLKVLYDAVGTTVSLELKNGELYTGTLSELVENMGVVLTSARKTTMAGREVDMPTVLVSGKNIVFFQLPDALQASPALLTVGRVVSSSLDDRGGGKGFGAQRLAKRPRR
uniref:Putative small nuclear ribonucleoprotein SmD3 n=1 Tax=Trypanosoma congolense (strain IL3000) TaxID=1068625 RepID=G0UKR2_TRYCI|nr:putative small nuclear ribonucleoprotein SmD3 [Trypanosoma congolense IL3000]